MLEGIIITGNEDMRRVYAIRNIAREQYPNLKHIFVDSFGDKEGYHVVVKLDDEDVATGTIYQDSNLNGDIYILDRIFVKKEYQGDQLGDLVIKMLIDRAFRIGAKQICVTVPSDVSGFFTRVGFYFDKSLNEDIEDKSSEFEQELSKDIEQKQLEPDYFKLVLTQNKLKKCRH